MLNKKYYLLILIIYLMTFAGRIGHRDGYVYYLSAKYFLNTGSFQIISWRNAEFMKNTWYLKKNSNNEYYQVFNYGVTFLCVIILFLTNKIFAFVSPVHLTKLEYFFISFLPLISIFVSGIFLNKILLLKKYSKKTISIVVTGFYFGSFAWVYTKLLFGEVISILPTITAFYYLLTWEKDKNNYSLFFSGTFLGLSYLFKILNLVFVPFFFLYLFFICYKQKFPQIFKTILIFSLGFIIFSGIQFYLNVVHFNNPLDQGRKDYAVIPFYYGLFYVFFGSNKSLFLFNPVTIFFLFGIKNYFFRFKLETVIFFSMILFYIIILTSYFDWSGSFCCGWRFFLPVLFLFLLPCAEFIENNVKKMKPLIYTVLIFSILIQIPAVLIDSVYPYQIALKNNNWLDNTHKIYFFIPKKNTIITQYKLLFNTIKKSFKFDSDKYYGKTNLKDYSYWNLWYINFFRFLSKTS